MAWNNEASNVSSARFFWKRSKRESDGFPPGNHKNRVLGLYYKQASKQASKQTNKQTNKRTNERTNKQTNKQTKTNKQTNKQTKTNKNKQKQTAKVAGPDYAKQPK